MISNRTLVISGIGLALILAAVVSPFASSSPDGLEKVAEEHKIEAAEHPLWTASLIPDYAMPGITHEGVATGVAGVIGTLGVLAAGLLIGRLLACRRTPAP